MADHENPNVPPAQEHPTASSGLLLGVQQMNPADWSRLVTTFGPIVYSWCRRAGVPEDDCPDLVQNVFFSVARGANKFTRKKETGSFRSWLATIVRTRVCDYFRKHQNTEHALGGSQAKLRLEQVEALIDESTSSDRTETLVVRQVLESIRSDFAAQTWQAFWSTTVEDKAAVEVAEITSLSVASVYQAKSRVLRRLREELRRLPD